MAAAPIHRSERPSRPLLWRVAATNAAIFSLGVGLLAVSPATVSFPVSSREAAVLAVGTALVALANVLALRRAFAPLARLSSQMARVDPLEPGIRALRATGAREIVALTTAFNQMAERLELERRQSARRALGAMEAERHRIAQDIHDDIGQSLTFLLIQLSRAGGEEGGELALRDAQETARGVLEDARSISARLRPESLDDLGLVIALETLASRVTSVGELTVNTSIERDLPELSDEAELAVFRIAQEGLTNVLRHAGAKTAWLALLRSDDGIVLRVEDDGRGLGDGPSSRDGFRSMRERALSVGGRLSVGASAGGGMAVELRVDGVRP